MSATHGGRKSSSSGIGGSPEFTTTHWSVVLAARGRTAPDGRAAMTSLCRTYWYPLYAYIRRQGYATHDAQDLTQEFFARLLEKEFLGSVDPHRGRFRSFLLACVQHFLSNERDRARARKRGGARAILSLDLSDAERRYALEPVDDLTPQRFFLKRWALTLLDRTLAQVRQQCVAEGRAELFDQLKPCITGGAGQSGYARIAATLGMTQDAVKSAAYRLRRRYRDRLRDEIAQTVADPAAIDDEIRDLFDALGG